MNRFIFLIILIHFFSVSGFSQSSVWTIEGKGTKMYVGGSIHILREQDYPLPDEFEQAFENSDNLVLEVDISPENQKTAVQEILGLTLYPNDKSLKTELTQDVYNKLDSAFTKSGLTLERMIGLKPVMAVLTLTQVELMKLGVTSVGVDKHFFEKANAEGKYLLFLENMEDQIKLIVNMGEGVENDYVLQSLEELKFYREEFEESIALWREGNISQWLEETDDYKNDYPELYQSLLVERNNNWMPQLEQYLETPEIEFVLVGAMHLPGPDGILQKMKEKGYKVEQL
jgi:uncharacterized protein